MSLERTLSIRLLSAHPSEAAAVLETMSPDVAASTLVDAPATTIAGVLRRSAPNQAAFVLGQLPPELAQGVIGDLGFDDTADLVRRMDEEPRERFVASLEPELATPLRTLLEFPEGTAGSLMDSRVLALPVDVTAGDAIDQIRRAPDHVRYNLYVVDRERRLVGVLNLRELMLADRDAELGSIARREVLSVEGRADRSVVMAHEAWREAHSLPVVDRQGTYLGAIRYRTWRLLLEDATRERARRDPTTADALGDLFSAGLAGVLGAFTHIVASPTTGVSVVRD